MKYIVLDTNIILRFPKLLGLRPSDIIFLIPLAVIQEINDRAEKRGDRADPRLDLIDEADREGAVVIVNNDLPVYRTKRVAFEGSHYLSFTDAAILSVALEYRDDGQSVMIATTDNNIIQAARLHYMDIFYLNQIEYLLRQPSQLTQQPDRMQQKIASFEKKESLNFYTGVGLGAVITSAITTLFKVSVQLYARLPVPTLIGILILSGVLLFIFRERFRLAYGVVEFLVGVIVIIALFIPSHFTMEEVPYNLDLGIKVSGGLYIMVRGQDNIIKSMKDKKWGIILKERYGIGK